MRLTVQEAGTVGKPILFFIHGWPDSADLWKEELTHFRGHFHCIAVNLPGFAERDPSRWGHDFPEIVERIAETIRHYAGQTPEKKVILVGHDWGAYLSYLVEQKHPELVKAMITLDVGGHFKAGKLKGTLFILGYQWWLIAAYFIGHVIPFIGDEMTRLFSRIARTPRRNDVDHGMNYLYFYFWRGRLKKYQSSILLRYRPAHPVLYIYGGKKICQFHSPKWETIVKETPGGRVDCLPECGHWFLKEQPEKVHAMMDGWLGATPIS